MYTCPPGLTSKWYIPKLIVSVSPFGIVNITLGGIITFAGAVAVLDREQLDVIFQSPDNGGTHWPFTVNEELAELVLLSVDCIV